MVKRDRDETRRSRFRWPGPRRPPRRMRPSGRRRADTPATRWIPPAGAVPPAPTPAPPPPELTPEKLRGRTVSLAEAIDVALRNSPLTRQSWLLARSAAAGVGSKRSAYYPSVELDAQACGRSRPPPAGASSTLLTTYGPTAILNWLLLDLGGRSADVAEAEALALRRRLHAQRRRERPDPPRRCRLLPLPGRRALLVGAGGEPQAGRGEPTRRPKSGTGPASRRSPTSSRRGRPLRSSASPTTPSRARSQIDPRPARDGARRARRTCPSRRRPPGGPRPSTRRRDHVDDLIAEAERQRPDLAAARSAAIAAERHVALRPLERSTRRSRRGASGAARTSAGSAATSPTDDNYSVGLLLRIPVFTGFQTTVRHAAGRSGAGAADAAAESVEQQVDLAGLDQLLQRADGRAAVRGRRATSSRARAESAEVARGPLHARASEASSTSSTAESALASARAQDVRSRAELPPRRRPARARRRASTRAGASERKGLHETSASRRSRSSRSPLAAACGAGTKKAGGRRPPFP